jgi:phenylacetate-CoA ligase
MNAFIEKVYELSPVFVQHALISAYGYYLNRSRYGGRCDEYAGRLLESQWFEPERLRALTAASLRGALQHAGERVPYYRALFQKIGFDPGRVTGPEDLAKIPVLEKETVRRHPGQFLAEGARGVKALSTSGTTGTPLTIFCNNDALQRNYAFFRRVAEWNGVRPGARRAIFGGRPIVPAGQKNPPFWRHHLSENSLYFSSFHLSPGHMPAYYERLRAFAPREIRTYPSSLLQVALYMNEKGLADIRPEVIVTSSETLFDDQRRLFQEVFGCPVKDQYGSTEFSVFISQCEEGTYHVHPEFGYVEIMKDGRPAGPGETGEIVCTGYVNPVMPLIRYRQGDLLKWSQKADCGCGRHFPAIETIEGRVDDIIVTPEGCRVGAIDATFKDLEGIKASQLVQVAPDRIVVRIVRSDDFREDRTGLIRKEFKKRLGGSVQIEFDFVEDIPREPSGKFRSVISMIK